MLPSNRAQASYLTSRKSCPRSALLPACVLQPGALPGCPVLTATCLPHFPTQVQHCSFMRGRESCFGGFQALCPSCHLQIKMRSQRLPEVTPWSAEVTSQSWSPTASVFPPFLTCGPAQPPSGVALCEGAAVSPVTSFCYPELLGVRSSEWSLSRTPRLNTSPST